MNNLAGLSLAISKDDGSTSGGEGEGEETVNLLRRSSSLLASHEDEHGGSGLWSLLTQLNIFLSPQYRV